MTKSLFKKSNILLLIPAGISFFLLTASPLFAAYSGHVASFKSEDNAVIFVNKMKAKGLVAFYQKNDISGKGEFYRSYIGRYETRLLAHKSLTKLKKAGVIDHFQIKNMAVQNGKIETKKIEAVPQKNEPAQIPENKMVPLNDNQNYYKDIKGIILNNGKVIDGQIFSIDNDVILIRTKEGKFLSYSFKKDVKKYITVDSNGYYKDIKGIILNNGKVIDGQISSIDNDVLKVNKNEGKVLLYLFKKDVKKYITVDTNGYYKDIKGIILNNGKVIDGQISSIDNDVLKIRTNEGEILSYSFMDEVKQYITK